MAQCTLTSGSSCSRPLPTVSIIGSAGRGGDGVKMNKSLFSKMVEKAKDVITKDFGLELSKVHLVSGGAAWADHVAVVLFVHGEVSQLTLHLPVKWQNSKYDEVDGAARNNPGHLANTLHQTFSTEISENTLEHIDCAITLGAKHCVHDGFLKRNTQVAKSQYLIAFSWCDGPEPKHRGGTRNTWRQCLGRKVHIPLNSLDKDVSIPQAADQNVTSELILSRKRELGTSEIDLECDSVQSERKRLKLES